MKREIYSEKKFLKKQEKGCQLGWNFLQKLEKPLLS
jgi:hypothetical protein